MVPITPIMFFIKEIMTLATPPITDIRKKANMATELPRLQRWRLVRRKSISTIRMNITILLPISLITR
jgi:hypothetical protein